MKKVLFLLLFLISRLSFSQELNCNVAVNFESLPVANRELLLGFDQVVEDYMNSLKITDIDYGPNRIKCSMTILFTGAASETNYSAQVVLVSQRPIYNTTKNSPILTINDNSWSFEYERGQPLYANQTVFNSITSYLDYYANIIIGLDMDSFEKLGGTPYFSKAYDIVNLGNTSAFTAGWQQTSSAYSRWGLVSDLLNDKYRPFREAYYNYHYNGLDIFNEYPETAVENIEGIVKTLEQMKSKVDIRGVLIRTFFDAKHGELLDYLKASPDAAAILKSLTKLDPAHASQYNEALKEAP
jgi:hypothetical protein